MKNILLWLSPLAAFLAASGTAAAQDADPPSRVARIAYLSGPVSFEPASLDQWADASLNYPMTTGDNLYTDVGARAVLRIGQNAIRLNSGANFQFVNLSDNVVQTSVNAGSLSLRVRHLFDSESWEVDTPNGAITILRTGEYRIDTDSSGNATIVTVRSGDVEVTANNQSFPVHSGQTAFFDNSGVPPDVQAASPPDDFDSFVSSRDRMEDVPPPQYVSPDMVGYEDLDANGDWRNTPEYGAVWTPRVAAGWTPYSDGYWAWVDPWGWSWVDNEPWGFAPFHYGRWALINNSWAWCPGAVSARVYYAPALVAFVGGAGFSAGVSIGGGGGLVGWFPLGPREVYYPSYHVSEGYVRQVNVTNTRITNINVTNVNVTNINYVNRGAVVAVPQNSFVSAQPVQRAVVHVDANQMRQAQVIGAAPKVAPQRESIVSNSNGRKAAAPPAALANRPVVAKLAPPPSAVPFAAKQQILQQHPGTPVEPAQLQTLRVQAARQNPAPARMQVKPVDPKQVHAVTPAVRPGPAPTFAQRPAQPQNRPAPPVTPAVPAVRTQTPPPVREQPQPPVHPAPPAIEKAPPVERPAPPATEKAPPAVRPAPPVTEKAPPAERQAPPVPEKAPPAVRPAPPVTEKAPPVERPAPPVPEKAQPAVRPAPPVPEKAPPAERQAPPVPEKAPPQVHQQAPPPRPQEEPKRGTPPSKKETKKPEEKKQ
jgi:hypothetical protein